MKMMNFARRDIRLGKKEVIRYPKKELALRASTPSGPIDFSASA